MNIPWISDEAIAAAAEGLLCRFNLSGTVPVNVEVLENRMKLQITPIPGLKGGRITTDGCLGGFNEIFVDETLLLSGNENRYRFTLAHEIGHIELHRELLESIQMGTIDQWISSMAQLDTAAIARMETQANMFAAAMLMPARDVSVRFDRWLPEFLDQASAAIAGGVPRNMVITEVIDQIANPLSDDFEVSSQAMQIRLGRLGLCERVVDALVDK